MKKLSLVVLLCILSVSLFSLGVLRVSELKELPETDMNISVRDADGEWAPVLLVKTELKGLGFTNVSRPTRHAAAYDAGDHQYKFYMNANQRVVKITHADYEPLEVRLLADYGIEAKAKRVYELVLDNQPEEVPTPVIITCNENEADILIDGKPVGTIVDGKFTGNLPSGEHRIVVQKNGFKSQVIPTEISMTSNTFDVILTPTLPAALTITSNPEGAQVYIDDVLFGTTPKNGFFNEGTYPIRISKQNYDTIQSEITIHEQGTEEHYTLEDIRATLTVKTFPNATVIVNNQRFTGGVNAVSFAPQVLNIRVEMSKAEPIERILTLKKRAHESIEMYPEVATGSIQVVTNPTNAKIELNGDAGEYYSATGRNHFADIPTGSYRLEVTAKKHKSYKETIHLIENETVTRQVALQVQKKEPKPVKKASGPYASAITLSTSMYLNSMIYSGFDQYDKDIFNLDADLFTSATYTMSALLKLRWKTFIESQSFLDEYDPKNTLFTCEELSATFFPGGFISLDAGLMRQGSDKNIVINRRYTGAYLGFGEHKNVVVGLGYAPETSCTNKFLPGIVTNCFEFGKTPWWNATVSLKKWNFDFDWDVIKNESWWCEQDVMSYVLKIDLDIESFDFSVVAGYAQQNIEYFDSLGNEQGDYSYEGFCYGADLQLYDVFAGNDLGAHWLYCPSDYAKEKYFPLNDRYNNGLSIFGLADFGNFGYGYHRAISNYWGKIRSLGMNQLTLELSHVYNGGTTFKGITGILTATDSNIDDPFLAWEIDGELKYKLLRTQHTWCDLLTKAAFAIPGPFFDSYCSEDSGMCDPQFKLQIAFYIGLN